MPRIVHTGSFKHRLKSWQSLISISLGVWLRRLTGKPLVKSWSAEFEIGVLFWRNQFNTALAMPKISNGREYFDSLQTYTDEKFNAQRSAVAVDGVKGRWITPEKTTDDITILYLHGGGYIFAGGISDHFADTLACLLGRKVFSLDYRLTPEHSHPAQLDDAIAAFQYLMKQGVDPSRLVIMGDSAGGHLTLMLLLAIRDARLKQPALAIGLCPWTDIGNRGESLTSNDPYDLIQGYMVLKFGDWLKAKSNLSREALSPIYQDFKNCAPIYMQGGEREVLIDMIKDFAQKLERDQHDVTLDVWPDMVHDFQMHGTTIPESKQAFDRMNDAIAHYTSGENSKPAFAAIENTWNAGLKKTI